MAEKLVGSALGAIAGGAASIIGRGLWGGAKTVGRASVAGATKLGAGAKIAGKASYNVGKNTVQAVGKQVLDEKNQTYVAAYGGQVAKNIGGLGARRIGNVAAERTLKDGRTIQRSVSGMSREIYQKNTARNMITGEKEFTGERGLELTGIAKTAIAGAFLYKGMGDMKNQATAENMGQIDSKKVNSTPTFDGYISTNRAPIGPLSGGADGSLVFALHDNR